MAVSIQEPLTSSAPINVISTKKRFAFRIVLIVLTLALWKGWAEESHFLDSKLIEETHIIQSGGSAPLFAQHVVDVNERDNRYSERENGQPLKLIPIGLFTLLAGWLAFAPQAKARIDQSLESIDSVSKGGMTILAVVAGCVSIIGAWMICGHASTGLFAGLVIGGYLYWLGRLK